MHRIAGSMLMMGALLSAAPANFVRPGLIIKITSAEIASDGTIRAKVKLTDPKGAPLDRDGVYTPGAVSVSFIAAYIPNGQTQYVAYTTRSQRSTITGVSAIQASADSGGVWAKTAEGEYTYTFATRAPQNADRSATHTIGAYGSRNLTEFDEGTQYDDDVFHFVPNGAKVTTVRDVIRNESCNACHHQMAFHGGSRRSIEVCVLCHTPQTMDPDTGNTVDMPVMTHKIHMGSSLPSVRAGKPYQIIGRSPADYSAVAFPADARRCSVCHESKAAQAGNVFKPNRQACGACHDDVNFDTGAGHVDLPQFSDNQCANCHIPQGEHEFDGSIIGSHVIPTQAPSLPGVKFEILSVENAVPGKAPTVAFSIKDKAGRPVRASALSSLNLYLAGPNTDFPSYLREDARTADGPGDGRHFWTFSRALPADAAGSWTVSIEGRRDAKVMEGTRKEVSVRDAGQNKIFPFAVSGPLQARRQVVSTAKCNACHGFLSAHGGNRNEVDHCVVCHNPNLVAGQQTVSFASMIHGIHSGRERAVPYVVGNTSFGEVGYPGKLQNCAACHVNGSEQLPLRQGLLPTQYPASPVGPLGPATAACTGCHASQAARAHAATNTSSQGEACATCHGPNSDASVSRAHAWQ
ncbi:MAG: OmcA/MtrC family decaheme c-type cytochrome [Bryobacteraceae bacterium]